MGEVTCGEQQNKALAAAEFYKLTDVRPEWSGLPISEIPTPTRRIRMTPESFAGVSGLLDRRSFAPLPGPM